MSSSSTRYGKRSNGLHHGDVFTSPDVVRFMLDVIGYTADKNLSNIFILEPSCGTGDFLIEIQKRIIQSSKQYNFNPADVFQRCVFACEIDEEKLGNCIKRLQILMPGYTPANIKNEDFLLTDWGCTFDIIVGNPPYVRYENIPANNREMYKHKFTTFHYRSDLYVLFYEHSLKFLKYGGKHCFICSNRWLKNESGKKLRSFITNCYNLEKLIDAETLDAFQENVLAYPVISVISNVANQFSVETAKIDNIGALRNKIMYTTKFYESPDNIDTIFTNISDSGLPTIEEQGFSIGIGVATGADRVFISKQLAGAVENERLLPIVNARDLSGNKFAWSEKYLLNPYDKNGNLVDIDNYPKAKEYLEQYKELLRNRHIVKNNKAWYSLIDKIKPNLASQPKILLPDISANTFVFVEDGIFYPAHNIYYITSTTNSKEQLSVLAAFLMSDFVRNQVSSLSNKMNGGLPRWQSQVIKKLRVPIIEDIPQCDKASLLSAYVDFNLVGINNAVEKILRMLPRFDCRQKRLAPRELSLFDVPHIG